MRNAVWGAAVLAAGMMFFAAPALAKICISIHDIVNSSPQNNGASLDFKMRDGTIWRNTLQGQCPDLKWNGFVWTIPGDTQVCEGGESLRVIHSGEVCLLGKFEKVNQSKTN
jgi:hypothetical protein